MLTTLSSPQHATTHTVSTLNSVPPPSPVPMSPRTHGGGIEQDQNSGPLSVDDKGCAQPHVDDEEHEVAMVVVSDAVEHPGCQPQGRAWNVGICTSWDHSTAKVRTHLRQWWSIFRTHLFRA